MGKDEAENAIRKAITDTRDMALATLNARWFLSKQRREQFGDTMVLEGGKTPIHVNTTHTPIESLNLPVEIKRKLLEALDAKEETERQQKLEMERQRVK